MNVGKRGVGGSLLLLPFPELCVCVGAAGRSSNSGVSSCIGWLLIASLSVQTNENMEITSTLQTEQYVKKELAKKLGQLQEKLGELKETVTLSQPRRAQTGTGPWGGGTWAGMSWVPGPELRQLPPGETGGPRVLQSL